MIDRARFLRFLYLAPITISWWRLVLFFLFRFFLLALRHIWFLFKSNQYHFVAHLRHLKKIGETFYFLLLPLPLCGVSWKFFPWLIQNLLVKLVLCLYGVEIYFLSVLHHSCFCYKLYVGSTIDEIYSQKCKRFCSTCDTGTVWITDFGIMHNCDAHWEMRLSHNSA